MLCCLNQLRKLLFPISKAITFVAPSSKRAAHSAIMKGKKTSGTFFIKSYQTFLYTNYLSDCTQSSDSQNRFILRKCYLEECWVLLRGKNWTDHQCSHYSGFFFQHNLWLLIWNTLNSSKKSKNLMEKMLMSESRLCKIKISLMFAELGNKIC